MSSIVGAIAIADLVKTTLGPKGMDKILQSTSREGDTIVTNDGATILKSLYVDNPTAKVLVDISKTQDEEVGDGTTSVCVLAGELLREAEQLINKHIHPQTIISGFRAASKIALAGLNAYAKNNSSDPEKFRKNLYDIACTTLSSKILGQEKDHFANLAVNAILRLKGSGNLEAIHIIKKSGGSLRDSFLDEGFILEKKIGVGQPKRIENPKILIANTAMDSDKIKIFGARLRVESPAEVAAIEAVERQRMLDKCQKIANHGINCFINRQLIYNLPEQFFAEKGIMAIEHADFEGIERLALVTGAEIVSTFDHPELVKLGTCKAIEEIILGEDKVIKFSGVPLGEACTVVLRGSSQHLLDEAERSLHDALCVLAETVKDPRVVLGGGASECYMAKLVEDAVASTPGKQALALESYARALRMIPTIIADNAGFDSSELVSELRAAHASGKTTAGLNMTEGCVGDVEELGITEAWRVKAQIVISATEAAEMILRINEIIRAAPRKREDDPRMHHGHGH
eukprot:TRINITY_DN7372_c0_g1_i3.p1 TRINITY_DN7372_c0_g1~~TRINITY_DN7372_c0_g1_i3.p1  ORF type:complete len:516 (+),score=147.70 TRINITY_DN7372_c0_g1_i3:99-1646(+)